MNSIEAVTQEERMEFLKSLKPADFLKLNPQSALYRNKETLMQVYERCVQEADRSLRLKRQAMVQRHAARKQKRLDASAPVPTPTVKKPRKQHPSMKMPRMNLSRP